MDYLRESFPHKDNLHLRNAYALCDLRTAFGRACLHPDCATLELLISEFKRTRDIPSHLLFCQEKAAVVASDVGAAAADPTKPAAVQSGVGDVAAAPPMEVGTGKGETTSAVGAPWIKWFTWEQYYAEEKTTNIDEKAVEDDRLALTARWAALIENPKVLRDNNGEGVIAAATRGSDSFA